MTFPTSRTSLVSMFSLKNLLLVVCLFSHVVVYVNGFGIDALFLFLLLPNELSLVHSHVPSQSHRKERPHKNQLQRSPKKPRKKGSTYIICLYGRFIYTNNIA